jgi:hypothetical protein
MPHYRAYIIGRDGHFDKAVELDCADDKAAMESAKQFVDGHDVELWQRDRRIAKFEAKEWGRLGHRGKDRNEKPAPALAIMAKFLLALIALALAVLIGAFVYAAFTL